MSSVSPENMQTLMAHTALLREKLSSDPYRPGYHFATPGDYGIPGDPNGAFYANGRYHLMYLYQSREDGFRYGHISSVDLVHWHYHPDAIRPDALDGGIFSGGAFLDDDGTAYMTYWGLPTPGATAPQCNGGIRIAYSRDIAHHYETWEKFPDYAIPATEFGILRVPTADGGEDLLGCADPSNLWRVGDTYYLQTGCLVALNQFRDRANAPTRMKGDWTDLFASRDLIHWEHRGRFYERKTDNRWTKEGEDDMCPSFLPLPQGPDGGPASGKYLQLFLAHNRGAQYYIGSYHPELADSTSAQPPFLPEQHGRMSWKDIACFAPEAMMDPKGRQLAWFWLRDDRYCDEREMTEYGWAGVFTLPRTLWLREDGTLGMDVVPEMKALQYGETTDLSRVDPRSCHVRLTRPSSGNTEKTEAPVGFRVHVTEQEYADLFFDASGHLLVLDAAHTVPGRDTGTREEAPLTLAPGEDLTMDLYVDHSVLEIFVNQKQAISRRIYWDGSPAPRIELLPSCQKDPSLHVTAWSMMESNAF